MLIYPYRHCYRKKTLLRETDCAITYQLWSHIQLSDGISPSSPELGQFCGVYGTETAPDDTTVIESSLGAIRLRFRSDFAGARHGESALMKLWNEKYQCALCSVEMTRILHLHLRRHIKSNDTEPPMYSKYHERQNNKNNAHWKYLATCIWLEIRKFEIS